MGVNGFPLRMNKKYWDELRSEFDEECRQRYIKTGDVERLSALNELRHIKRMIEIEQQERCLKNKGSPWKIR